MLYTAGLKILGTISRALFRIRIDGAQRIPQSGAVLLLSNHRSVCDPLFLAMGCPRPIRYMAKSELFDEHGKLSRGLLYRAGGFSGKPGKQRLDFFADGAVAFEIRSRSRRVSAGTVCVRL